MSARQAPGGQSQGSTSLRDAWDRGCGGQGHNSYRLVPTELVTRAVAFSFAKVSSDYREEWGMEFYEFEFLSTHYHLVLYDRFGKVTDFLQTLNSVIARELNSFRGTGGKFFADGPGIQTILGDERILEAGVYCLGNAVKAGIVEKTRHWKGFNSLRMEYGKEYVIKKPCVGLWSKKLVHKGRRSSRRSGRAAFAGRSKMPKTAILKLDRPRIMPELFGTELRKKVRDELGKYEAEAKAERAGKPVMTKVARKIDRRTVPQKGKELFVVRPPAHVFDADARAATGHETTAAPGSLGLRGRARALEHGERDVVFPAGTVRMRLRHRALTEPIPLDLLLAA